MGTLIVSKSDSNAKTAKMLAELEIEGVILHLAPSNISGVNVCPAASPGCSLACLNTAGLGRFESVQSARIRRTKLFFEARAEFMDLLCRDLRNLVRRAARKGLRPVARLNGTSDISWERYPVTFAGIDFPNIFAAFPDVTFYDYTKVLARLERCRDIPNYHLTFSLSESNDRNAVQAIRSGFNVAAVIEAPCDTWGGFPVIDGDKNDFRFLDPSEGGHVVALYPKGKAKKDLTGFVRPVDGNFEPERRITFGRAA